MHISDATNKALEAIGNFVMESRGTINIKVILIYSEKKYSTLKISPAINRIHKSNHKLHFQTSRLTLANVSQMNFFLRERVK